MPLVRMLEPWRLPLNPRPDHPGHTLLARPLTSTRAGQACHHTSTPPSTAYLPPCHCALASFMLCCTAAARWLCRCCSPAF